MPKVHEVSGVYKTMQQTIAALKAENERLQEELRQAREKAPRSSQLEWTAGLAHEFRNPMSAIGNCIEILSKTLKLEGDEKELIDIALSEWERLNRVINDFLSFARPKLPDRREVDAHTLLARTLTLLQHDMRYTPAIQLVQRYGQSVPKVPVDTDQFSQMMWNLTLNAVQAMPAGGKLTVETGVEDALVDGTTQYCFYVTVSDDGSGMPEDVKDKALRAFFTTKASGSGLGLAIVHQIVEAHGGLLKIESEEGKGTTVKVYLPLPASSVAPSVNDKAGMAVEVALPQPPPSFFVDVDDLRLRSGGD